MIGWLKRLFCLHDLYFVRTLITLAEVRCRRCDGHWLHKMGEGIIPWPKGADAFFDAREAGR